MKDKIKFKTTFEIHCALERPYCFIVRANHGVTKLIFLEVVSYFANLVE